ncbi:MAG: hypothetical protein ABIY56_08330 [Dokdonella sp.]
MGKLLMEMGAKKRPALRSAGLGFDLCVLSNALIVGLREADVIIAIDVAERCSTRRTEAGAEVVD